MLTLLKLIPMKCFVPETIRSINQNTARHVQCSRLINPNKNDCNFRPGVVINTVSFFIPVLFNFSIDFKINSPAVETFTFEKLMSTSGSRFPRISLRMDQIPKDVLFMNYICHSLMVVLFLGWWVFSHCFYRLEENRPNCARVMRGPHGRQLW